MKEKFKRFFASIAAIILAIGMMGANAIPAMAADDPSITINKPTGATSTSNTTQYEYFEVFKATFGDNDAVSYYIPSPDNDGLKTALDAITVDVDGTATDAFTFEKSADGKRWNVTFNIANVNDNSDTAKALAAAISNVITSENAISHNTFSRDRDGNATSGKVDAGYYLVKSSLGTNLVLDTLKPVTITEKNTEPTNDKTQSKTSDGTFAEAEIAQQIGKDVFYHVDVTIPASAAEKEIKVVDTMSKGLTLNNTITYSAKVNNTAITDVTLTAPTTWTENTEYTATDNEKQYTVTIPAADVKALAAKATAENPVTLTLSYSAKVNKDAVVKGNGNTNKAHIEYDHIVTPDKTVTTKTYQFNVHKYANSDTDGHLANAVFQLQTTDGTVVNLVKVSDTEYRVADATETTTPVSHVKEDGTLNTVANNSVVSDFITVSSGDIVIKGVDATTEANYKLHEIKAPEGFNLLTSDENVTVATGDTDTTVQVQNKSGSELPSTGGIGTTIFYVIGGAVVAGAVILLLARRRKNA